MNEPLKWYEKNGPQGDVAVSVRVRLARNLQGYPFPGRLNDAGKKQVLEVIKEAVLGPNSLFAGFFAWVPVSSLSRTAAVSLVERHLVSPEFISRPQGRALLLSKDESIEVMINEEDHIRIQVLQEGLSLKEAWQTASRLDDALNERLSFAFDPHLGYLTQSPVDLGTGMRASLVLHLPAMEESGVIGRTASNLSKLGLSLQSAWGEGEEVVGCLYQFSNRVTLGLSEEEALSNLETIAMQLLRQERGAREKLMQRLDTQDTVARSLGILQNARLLGQGECPKLLSNVRLGVSCGFLKGISLETLNSLLVLTQPATLRLPSGQEELPGQEQEILRARLVRRMLANPAEMPEET